LGREFCRRFGLRMFFVGDCGFSAVKPIPGGPAFHQTGVLNPPPRRALAVGVRAILWVGFNIPPGPKTKKSGGGGGGGDGGAGGGGGGGNQQNPQGPPQPGEGGGPFTPPQPRGFFGVFVNTKNVFFFFFFFFFHPNSAFFLRVRGPGGVPTGGSPRVGEREKKTGEREKKKTACGRFGGLSSSPGGSKQHKNPKVFVGKIGPSRLRGGPRVHRGGFVGTVFFPAFNRGAGGPGPGAMGFPPRPGPGGGRGGLRLNPGAGKILGDRFESGQKQRFLPGKGKGGRGRIFPGGTGIFGRGGHFFRAVFQYGPGMLFLGAVFLCPGGPFRGDLLSLRGGGARLPGGFFSWVAGILGVRGFQNRRGTERGGGWVFGGPLAWGCLGKKRVFWGKKTGKPAKKWGFQRELFPPPPPFF